LDANRQMQASRVEVLSLQLKALAGMAPDAPLALRGDLASSADPPAVEDAIRLALATRPDLDAARVDVSASHARVRKEQAEGRWDASVNVGYQRQDMGFGLLGLTPSGTTRPIQDVFHFFGAGVSVMLPVRNRNQGNIAAAQAETRAAERRADFPGCLVRSVVAPLLSLYLAGRPIVAILVTGG